MIKYSMDFIIHTSRGKDLSLKFETNKLDITFQILAEQRQGHDPVSDFSDRNRRPPATD